MEWEGLLLLSQGVNCLMARLSPISEANDWVNAKKIRGTFVNPSSHVRRRSTKKRDFRKETRSELTRNSKNTGNKRHQSIIYSEKNLISC